MTGRTRDDKGLLGLLRMTTDDYGLLKMTRDD